jgi:type II secretory pathway component PulC
MKNLPRAYWLSAILGLIAWALGLALALEWVVLKRHRPPAPPQSATTANPAETRGDSPFVMPEESTFEQITQRPLFMENRQPGKEPSAEQVVEKAPPGPMQFKLMGIIQTPQGTVVLLVDGKGKYKRIRVKDSLDGWQLMEVKEDRVVLQQGDRHEELALLKKRAKSPTPVAPALTQSTTAPPTQVPPPGHPVGRPVPVAAPPNSPAPDEMPEEAPVEEDAEPDSGEYQ